MSSRTFPATGKFRDNATKYKLKVSYIITINKLTHLKKLIVISLLLAGIITMISCEKDFKTIADYKDITIVYALLDQHDENIFIKVNKAFLGEGDALIMAQQPDSSNYPWKLNVRIDEYNGNSKVRTIEFDTTTLYNKEPGIFYYPNQPIYKSKPFQWYKITYYIGPEGDTTDYDTIWLNEDHKFKLTIEYPDTSKTITSETYLIHDFTITKPGYSKIIKFTNDPDATTTIRWNKPSNNTGEDQLYRYELSMKLNYRENSIGHDTIDKSLTFFSVSLTPGENLDEITYNFPDHIFFNTCQNKIPYSDPQQEANVVGRYSENVEIDVAVANEDFTLFLEVYEPSTSIVQEKPVYTNINNGIGLFSSRYKKKKTKKLHAETVSELNNLGLKFVY